MSDPGQRRSVRWHLRAGARRALESAAAGRRARRSQASWRDREPGGEDDWLTPVLVDYSTRDGSTLLMRLLASSPEIAVEPPYPYERKYFTYLWRWSRLLDAARWPERWGPGELRSITEEGSEPMMGAPPWTPRTLIEPGSGEDELSRRLFELAWFEFSRRAARRTRAEAGEPRARVRYYAEKHLFSWLLDLGAMPPLRLIALLRDPRDSYASMLAFDRARGGPGFGAGRAASLLDDAIAVQADRLRWIAGLEEAGSVPVVRYEELVRDLAGVATRLGEWLGVELDPAPALGDRSMLRLHSTADTPDASIGRWRGELDEETAARFQRELGPELARLGFDAA